MNNESLRTPNEYGDRSSTEAIDAKITTEVFFGASAGLGDEFTRKPGLILTKEQIISLRIYELAGLKLPTALRDVVAYLGYSTGAGKGLEARDFQKSFTLIRTHAQKWSPLRTRLINVGSQLQVFAGQMVQYGRSMEEVYDDLKTTGTLRKYNIKTLADLKKLELELGDKFPGIEFDEEDKSVAQDFDYFLGKILKGVNQRKEEAKSIKDDLDAFGRELSLNVLPEVQRKVTAIDMSSLPAEIQTLMVIIEKRALDIAELNKEYKALVNQSLNAVTGLNIISLGMSIYYGVEADKARIQRNALSSQQHRDVELLNSKNNILGSLSQVKLNLQNLETVVVDADVATKNLITTWDKLYIFIEMSYAHVLNIKDGLSIRAFMGEFRQVTHPWATIEVETDELLAVFKQAYDELKSR